MDMGMDSDHLNVSFSRVSSRAQLESRSPVRWDPFHYEPFMYEVLNTLLIGQICGPRAMRWACGNDL